MQMKPVALINYMTEQEKIEILESKGNNHISTSVDTPLRKDAFEKSEAEKIDNIQFHFSKIMEELGLDMTDDSLSGTPYRVAKMYVKELFYGLDPKNKPILSVFENSYKYKRLLIEKDIKVNSVCEHHFLPITGVAHVAYIPGQCVIGLSKINRLVQYYAHRPQVQERLCRQVLEGMQEALNTEDVIVVINAKHSCVSSRGIKDDSSSMITIEFGGAFNDVLKRKEFFNLLKS